MEKHTALKSLLLGMGTHIPFIQVVPATLIRTWGANHKKFRRVLIQQLGSMIPDWLFAEVISFLGSNDRAENPTSWAAGAKRGGLKTSATSRRFPAWSDTAASPEPANSTDVYVEPTGTQLDTASRAGGTTTQS